MDEATPQLLMPSTTRDLLDFLDNDLVRSRRRHTIFIDGSHHQQEWHAGQLRTRHALTGIRTTSLSFNTLRAESESKRSLLLDAATAAVGPVAALLSQDAALSALATVLAAGGNYLLQSAGRNQRDIDLVKFFGGKLEPDRLHAVYLEQLELATPSTIDWLLNDVVEGASVADLPLRLLIGFDSRATAAAGQIAEICHSSPDCWLINSHQITVKDLARWLSWEDSDCADVHAIAGGDGSVASSLVDYWVERGNVYASHNGQIRLKSRQLLPASAFSPTQIVGDELNLSGSQLREVLDLLEIASVLGRTFPKLLIETACDLNEDARDSHLAMLSAHPNSVLSKIGDSMGSTTFYTFRHPALRMLAFKRFALRADRKAVVERLMSISPELTSHDPGCLYDLFLAQAIAGIGRTSYFSRDASVEESMSIIHRHIARSPQDPPSDPDRLNAQRILGAILALDGKLPNELKSSAIDAVLQRDPYDDTLAGTLMIRANDRLEQMEYEGCIGDARDSKHLAEGLAWVALAHTSRSIELACRLLVAEHNGSPDEVLSVLDKINSFVPTIRSSESSSAEKAMQLRVLGEAIHTSRVDSSLAVAILGESAELHSRPRVHFHLGLALSTDGRPRMRREDFGTLWRLRSVSITMYGRSVLACVSSRSGSMSRKMISF